MPKDKRGPEQLPARFIELIGRLYKVEAEARRDTLDAQALQQARQLHSAPLLKQIEALALQHLHGVLPGSLLGKALHYITAQWPKLVRYVEDGRYPIDTDAFDKDLRSLLPDKQVFSSQEDAPAIPRRTCGSRALRQQAAVAPGHGRPSRCSRALGRACSRRVVTRDQP